MFTEGLFVHHQPPSRSDGLKALYAFGTSYLSFFLYVALTQNYWAYPVFEVLTWPWRIGFIAALAVTTYCMYVIGEILYFVRWTLPSGLQGSYNLNGTCDLAKES